MRRRDLVQRGGLAAIGAIAGQAPALAAQGAKAPFRVLFSNDTTNIISCASPYHRRGDRKLTTEMIQATVDEAAGVDAHMLQPGLGWIPWWRSKLYPAEEHYRWVKETYGAEPDPFGEYVLQGGDIVEAFVSRCRKARQTPFVSFRLNDGHHLENAGIKGPRAVWCSRFYVEHPEYRLGTDQTRWEQRVHNWAIPQVREHKFGFIREICENYDIDGLELDFMRYVAYFNVKETTSVERARIMTAFVARVRKLLDDTSRKGRRRWLCARVPCFLAAHDHLGIDLPAMVDAGLDMVNLSGYYFTIQQTDLPKIRPLIPRAAVYLEMTQSVWNGPSIPGKYDSFPFLRTSEHQFYTGAHLAYSRGADGVSLFNFVYYREHGTPDRGPFSEPPFHVLKRLGDRQWLARQPQSYLLSKAWQNVPLIGRQPLPQTFAKGRTQVFELDLAPAAGRNDGVFRLRSLQGAEDRRWRVKINSTELERREYVAHPLPDRYNAPGNSKEWACFRCPRNAVRPGMNQISVTLEEGEPATVEYLDLALP